MATAPDIIEVVGDENADPTPLQKLIALAQAEGDISHVISDADLARLGSDVVADYEQDRADRSEWEETVANAFKAAAQEKKDRKSYPWDGASNVSYPLLTTAALQFAARAYPAIVKGDEAVSVKVIGSDQEGAKAARATRVKTYLNTVIFYRMTGWEEDTDALLHQLPIAGCVFRKCSWDRGAPRSEMVPAMRLVVPVKARDLASAPRYTEMLEDVFPHSIVQKQREGIYREVSLPASGDHEDAPRLLLEQHRLIDMDDDGLPEPYVVTVDHATTEVLRIEPAFSPADVQMDPDTDKVLRINRQQHYVKYGLFPDPKGGFYDIGFGHLLSELSGVVDRSINMIIDAGNAQVAGGGFIGSGVELQGAGKRGQNIRFSPGEYKTVSATGSQLREGIYERTFPGPSPVMFTVLDMILSAAKDISSIKDVITGDAPANAPVGTTLALIEQGLQVFSAIYKRVYRSLRQEYQVLYDNLSRYGGDRAAQDYSSILDDQGANFEADFNMSDMDIRPVSDPSSVTKMQQMARAQFLMTFISAPGVNPQAIYKRAWEAADIEDADELLLPPAPPAAPPPDLVAKVERDGAAAAKDRAQTESIQLDNLAKSFAAGQAIGLA